MDYTNKRVFLLLILGFLGCSTSMGAVYQVGDAAGWNAMGTDYNAWASNINFQLGDTIVFNYNNQMHDVFEVSSDDFNACRYTVPIVAYTSGNDQVILSTPGEHYYICSYPGMCQAGQKLKIQVFSSNNQSPPSPVGGNSVPGTNIPGYGYVPTPPVGNSAPNTNKPRGAGEGVYAYPLDLPIDSSAPLISFHNKLGLIALFTSSVLAFYIH
ncbi:hypothetical protein ACJIZ3_010914 [Penstemon smallii]|uniref:Phytocyanin domain-containing protein n=1 Tax=Penstemon smallii TaxID=265156 RepID=A0ABD3UHS2_9LAMI